VISTVLIIISVLLAIFAFIWVAHSVRRSWREIDDKLNELEKVAKPQIVKFVGLYVDDINNLWPTDEDFNVFRNLLIREGVSSDLAQVDNLKALVCMEIGEQVANNFKTLLYKNNPFLSLSPSTDDLISAYINSFGNNLDHVGKLDLLVTSLSGDETKYKTEASNRMHAKTRNYSSVYEKADERWRQLIQAQIQKISEERRLQEMAQAMKDGTKSRRISIDDLDILTGVEFESFLSDLFKRMGYHVETTKTTGDQGADLVIEKIGMRTIIQAKRYSGSVGNSAVQQVVAAMKHYNCKQAIVITTGTFTKGAVDLAKSNDVELWDRQVLTDKMINYS
jgi:hypothetical protein